MKAKQGTVVAQILERARALVAEGFVKERGEHSAEDAKGKLVRFTDPGAVRFSPSGAIWRAESEILPRVRDERERHKLRDLALKHFARSAPEHSQELYSKMRKIDAALLWFDQAIKNAPKALAATSPEM